MERRQIIEARSTCDRDLIRLGIDFGEFVARVVALELRLFAWLGANEIDPPTCRIIFGTALRRRPIWSLYSLKFFRDVAGFGIPHMDMQYRCASIVAIHRDLGLLLPGDRELLFRCAVLRHPHRPVGRRGDHQRSLIFG